jgi:ABC-type proline/glycine betaine transport system ATPase subunit
MPSINARKPSPPDYDPNCARAKSGGLRQRIASARALAANSRAPLNLRGEALREALRKIRNWLLY